MSEAETDPGAARPVMFRAGSKPGAAVTPDGGAAAAFPSFSQPYVLCADVSEFQPDINDPVYLKWSKAIVIRALYGDAHDDNAWFGGQRRDLLHLGGAKFLGIYQYLVAGQPGAAQAQAFHALVGAIRPGEVFIADFEEGTSKQLLTDWYDEMLKLYGQGIARYLWTYTYVNFGTALGVLPVEWLAYYGIPEPSSPHKMWQFTDKYPVPGVGTCDCSVFHGTIEQLAALAYQAPVTPPAGWNYGPVLDIQVQPGRHNFHATWKRPDLPGGAPAPDHYLLYVYKGLPAEASAATLVAGYPRSQVGTVTVPDPGGLHPSTEYTLFVVASGPAGTHVGPGGHAHVTFTTQRPIL